MAYEDLKSELEQLRKENAALKKEVASGIRLKVSGKGAVSVYGPRRSPVTLYKEQWLKLLDRSSDIRAIAESIFAARSWVRGRQLQPYRPRNRAMPRTPG
jgi:hypothetical protein